MADKSENNGEATEGNLPAKSTPKDALVMTAILKEMGISEYEPRVVNQMLEFTYRYITTVLEDAQVYCKHAGKKELDAEDVQLAIQSRLDHSYTNPPPREFLIEIARQKNRHPLPQLQAKSGLRLPPDRYCLTSTNYKVKAQKKHSQVRANSLVTRTLSQSSALPSTPASIKTTTATIITVKMPTTATPTVGTTANTTALTGSSAVTSGGTVMIKKEPPSGGSSVLLMKAAGAATAAAAAAGTKGTTVAMVKTQPPATGANKPSATGTETPSQTGTTGNPMSMLTVSALPSMDETVASTQQPLISGLKRKHEDEDDDYDS